MLQNELDKNVRRIFLVCSMHRGQYDSESGEVFRSNLIMFYSVLCPMHVSLIYVHQALQVNGYNKANKLLFYNILFNIVPINRKSRTIKSRSAIRKRYKKLRFRFCLLDLTY